MTSQSARPSLPRLGASLISAFIMITMSTPAFASGLGMLDGALNSKSNGMHLAQMGEMGGKMGGGKMSGGNKPSGVGGGVAGGGMPDMPCCMSMMGTARSARPRSY